MGKVISITNHKGGVGKSALVQNLSSYLLKYFKKTLVIDLDPQRNLTRRLCQEADELKVLIQHILRFGVTNDTDRDEVREELDEMIAAATIRMFKPQGELCLIGSSLDLATTKIELSRYETTVYFRVQEILTRIARGYDLVLIDTPPSMEMLTLSAINSSDYIILPVHPDLDAISGASDILTLLVPTVHKYYNPRLKVLGVVINLDRNTIAQRASKKAAQIKFGDKLFRTIIDRSEDIGRLAVMRGMVHNDSPGSKADMQLSALAEEIYSRILQYDPTVGKGNGEPKKSN
jgi:chromosome partitioning protein